MNEVNPLYTELRLVSTTPFPERLFVCLARIKDDIRKSLKQLFPDGKITDKVNRTAMGKILFFIFIILFPYQFSNDGNYS